MVSDRCNILSKAVCIFIKEERTNSLSYINAPKNIIPSITLEFFCQFKNCIQFFSSRRELSKPQRELLNPRCELNKLRRELKNLLEASYFWIVDMETLICPVEKLFL